MQPLTIAVLFGGRSSEHEVSLQSVCSVIENLDPQKYHVILLGITREGKWLKYSGDANGIQNGTWHEHPECVPAVISPDRNTHGILILKDGNAMTVPIDLAFPVMHGKYGEDGTIQGLLELAGIPCVGCGTLCSALCMDKDAAHKLASLAGIKVPPSVVLDYPLSGRKLEKLASHLHYPLFVKPANAGSSFGISRAAQKEELAAAVQLASQHDRKVIIEEAVDGFEVGCAILGNDILTIGAVDEIELTRGFFDYTEKYTLKTSKIHVPARIDADASNRIRQTAEVIYRVLGCRGFARVDLFLTPEKEIIFNEVNTIPGLTTHSRYPNMLREIGMSFAQIMDELIRLAMQP